MSLISNIMAKQDRRNKSRDSQMRSNNRSITGQRQGIRGAYSNENDFGNFFKGMDNPIMT